MEKIMVAAGETSGDMHAARVVREIKNLVPDITIRGMGSENLRQEGVEIFLDPTDINSVGFGEALSNIRTHYSHLQLMEEEMNKFEPDVLFMVDYSGFNMFLARIARKQDIPAVSYFPPTAWIWGRYRARWMARQKVTIAAIFPPEREVYIEAGADVKFVGHPLLDIVEVKERDSRIIRRLEIDPRKPVIGLLPGSRKNEIENLLPLMLKAAAKLQEEDRSIQFILPLARGLDRDRIVKMVRDYKLVIKIVDNYTYQTINICDLIVAASGTVTIEATILETPMIIIYRTGKFNYLLARKLFGLQQIGMPNLIARREIVPELIQDKCNPEKIYGECKNLIYKPYLLKDIKRNLQWVKKLLGNKGALEKTARLVLKKGAIKIAGE